MCIADGIVQCHNDDYLARAVIPGNADRVDARWLPNLDVVLHRADVEGLAWRNI